MNGWYWKLKPPVSRLPPVSKGFFMKKFKDNNNTEWDIAINVAAVRKVRDRLNADLLDIQATMPRLLADPIFLVDVIYVLCEPQATEKSINDEQFGEAMAGDALGAAKQALIDELKCFFPTREERDAVERAIQKGLEMVSLLRKKGTEKMNAMDMNAEADRILKMLGNSFMSLPESSDSSPTNSRSDS